MLIMWQALAFTACVLVGLLPKTEVQCAFNMPVAEVSPAPPPVRAPERVEPPTTDPPPAVTSADQSTPAPGTVEPQRN